MLSVKPGELVFSGEKDKIQFFELNSRKLKEIININRDIHWAPSSLLCMLNERCLCIGGLDKKEVCAGYVYSYWKRSIYDLHAHKSGSMQMVWRKTIQDAFYGAIFITLNYYIKIDRFTDDPFEYLCSHEKNCSDYPAIVELGFSDANSGSTDHSRFPPEMGC